MPKKERNLLFLFPEETARSRSDRRQPICGELIFRRAESEVRPGENSFHHGRPAVCSFALTQKKKKKTFLHDNFFFLTFFSPSLFSEAAAGGRTHAEPESTAGATCKHCGAPTSQGEAEDCQRERRRKCKEKIKESPKSLSRR